MATPTPTPVPLPATEKDLLKALHSRRIQYRPNYLRDLALGHGESLLPLIEQLLATEPTVRSIPVPRPPQNEADLNADGGNPNPEFDVETLLFPQTNASSRYLQRDAGLTLAAVLANKGSDRAIAILLTSLNHPYQVGRKRLVQCLAACAKDEDILAASQGSAPAVRDALVAALAKQRRKVLINDILGKPRKESINAEVQAPVTTRLRKALEQAKEFERENVWNEYKWMLDVNNQPKRGMCEPGESIKDVVLTLQEMYPPLHVWDSTMPEARSPKLASLVENSLVAFLHYDAKRVVKILKTTSWRALADKKFAVSIPKVVTNHVNGRRFWCHHNTEGDLLEEYWLDLISVADGELVKTKALPNSKLFAYCRGAVVDKLTRAALTLIDHEEFKTQSTQPWIQASRLDGILDFVASGVSNLTRRLTGSSTYKERTGAATYFHDALRELITLNISTAMKAIRFQVKDDEAFNQRLYNTVLQPIIGDQTPSDWDAPRKSIVKDFPPLGQHVFEQIQVIFKHKLRKDNLVKSIIENLVNILAPRDTSVYAIPDDKVEPPFTSVPDWDNKKVYQVCVAGCLNRPGKAPIRLNSAWISHFCKLAPHLTDKQREEVVTWIVGLPSFKPLLIKDKGLSVLPMLEKLCTNSEQRHKLVYPLVFAEKNDKSVDLGDQITDWAVFVDIRAPGVRNALARETLKPAFEDRLKWITAFIKATRLTGDVNEWILTMKWLVPKIRNEIQPNLMTLSPFLLPRDGRVPRQYLDKATDEQAEELVTLYLAMDAQNSAAVSPVSGITKFMDKIATEALNRFIDRPSHPFYHLGTEIPWRRKLSQLGETAALEKYSLTVSEPCYSSFKYERNEEAEIHRRQILAKQVETEKTEGGSWGNILIPEGQEEVYVQGLVNAYYSRWLQVKFLLDPEAKGDDLAAFKKYRKELWRFLCTALLRSLGWRWKNSPTLVEYLDEVLVILAKAPKKTFGSDEVLDWSTDDKALSESAKYVKRVIAVYNDDWLRKHQKDLPWFQRFSELRLHSTMFSQEVQRRVDDCVLENGKKDQAQFEALMEQLLSMSPSAIHITSVKDYVVSERPDLLTDRLLTMPKGIIGIFNQVDTALAWNLFINTPARLSPHQCELLKARHLAGMTDASTPFSTRVQHAQFFMSIPTTTVEDVAKALGTPSLPSRITEALLMFLPTLGEPASTLQLLMAPAYVQSHFARTSIHAVENALKCVPPNQIPDFILPLFPAVGERQQKVTVQKEGIRLACASLELMINPRVGALIKGLWERPELHKDARFVLLQALISRLASPEAKEERYKDLVEWIWKAVAETARSDAYKKNGVAIALLAVLPSPRDIANTPSLLLSGISTRDIGNTTLTDTAVIRLPLALTNRYVDEVLIPMAAKPSEEKETDRDLKEVSILAIQLLTHNEGWITPQNAVRLAKNWRMEALLVPIKEDKFKQWLSFAAGIARCVGKEVSGALESGDEAKFAWNELIGLVQDQVNFFLDKTQTRTLRQKALERINSLYLGSNLVFVNFTKAVEAGAFTGNELDIAKPLLEKGIESVTWTTALQREITVFKPQTGMTQAEINKEALRILLRIVDYSNRYLSPGHDVRTWIWDRLMLKANNNDELKRFIGLAALEPREELIDWIHVDEVALSILDRNRGVFNIEEIGTFIERLAHQDHPAFYWTNRSRIANVISAEIVRMFNDKGGKMADFPLLTKVLTPMMDRAREAKWLSGPDVAILTTLMNSHMNIICTAFPKDASKLLHGTITSQLNSGQVSYSLPEQLYKFTDFGWYAMTLGNLQAGENNPRNASYGISPATVLIMEAYMHGRLADFDLTPFIANHQMGVDTMYGYFFPFRGGSGPESSKALGVEDPVTLEQVNKKWNELMNDIGDYFKPTMQAVKNAIEKPMSPMVVQAYANHAIDTIGRHSKFIVMRPYVFLDFVRLALTAPGSTFSTGTIASHMALAFSPVRDGTGDEFSYAWSPPLGLALSMAEYLLDEIREEVVNEGQREAQLIEQMTADFLKSWLSSTVETKAGMLMAENEGKEALEARYLALVEKLCEDGSGGQSIALQLGDFIPGGYLALKEQDDDTEDEEEEDEGEEDEGEEDEGEEDEGEEEDEDK
ncbi:hypothetical protein KI688_008152 [Linnemannia hyalina]|uniref:Uncharacterized protein n=1 Tax=Linnemannia hyalina TaxID=64524 RepID=A0A9P8BVL3_9FUNG|nr:hypothetical protein KI688_008152 [Linnemannia hyalina]